jgi:hypothetical protein
MPKQTPWFVPDTPAKKDLRYRTPSWFEEQARKCKHDSRRAFRKELQEALKLRGVNRYQGNYPTQEKLISEVLKLRKKLRQASRVHTEEEDEEVEEEEDEEDEEVEEEEDEEDEEVEEEEETEDEEVEEEEETEDEEVEEEEETEDEDESKAGPLYSLCDSARCGRVDDIHRILGEHPTLVNESNIWPPIVWAASWGQLESIQELVRYGANVNKPGLRNETAAHQALLQNHVNAFALLVAHGADTKLKDDDGRTPLECAKTDESLAKFSRCEKFFAKVEVDKKPQWFDIDSEDKFKLKNYDENWFNSKKAKRGFKKEMQLALRLRGINTLQHHSVHNSRLIKRLLMFKTKVKNHSNVLGIGYAISEGWVERVKEIVEMFGVSTADGDMPITIEGQSPLAMAVKLKKSEVVGYLLKAGMDVRGVYIKNSNGSAVPILHKAVQNRDIDTVRLLLAKGADFNETDTKGKKAIDYATNIDISREFTTVECGSNEVDEQNEKDEQEAEFENTDDDYYMAEESDIKWLEKCPDHQLRNACQQAGLSEEKYTQRENIYAHLSVNAHAKSKVLNKLYGIFAQTQPTLSETLSLSEMLERLQRHYEKQDGEFALKNHRTHQALMDKFNVDGKEARKLQQMCVERCLLENDHEVELDAEMYVKKLVDWRNSALWWVAGKDQSDETLKRYWKQVPRLSKLSDGTERSKRYYVQQLMRVEKNDLSAHLVAEMLKDAGETLDIEEVERKSRLIALCSPDQAPINTTPDDDLSTTEGLDTSMQRQLTIGQCLALEECVEKGMVENLKQSRTSYCDVVSNVIPGMQRLREDMISRTKSITQPYVINPEEVSMYPWINQLSDLVDEAKKFLTYQIGERGSEEYASNRFHRACVEARRKLFTILYEYRNHLAKEMNDNPAVMEACFKQDSVGVRSFKSEHTYAKTFLMKHLGDYASSRGIDVYHESEGDEFRRVYKNISRFRATPEFLNNCDNIGGVRRPDFNGSISVGGFEFRFAVELKFGRAQKQHNLLYGQVGSYLDPKHHGFDFLCVLAITTNNLLRGDRKQQLLGKYAMNPRVMYECIFNDTLSEVGGKPEEVPEKDEVDEDTGDTVAAEEEGEDAIDEEECEQSAVDEGVDNELATRMDNQDLTIGDSKTYGADFNWYLQFKFKNGENESDGYTNEYEQVFFEKEEYVHDMLDVCRPDHPYLRGSKENMLNRRRGIRATARRVAGGATQVGKTWFKILAALCAKQQDVATIVVTTTCAGAKELARKIGRQTERFPVRGERLNVAYHTTKYEKGELSRPLRSKKAHEMRRHIINSSGCLVLSNTSGQINEVIKVLDEVMEETSANSSKKHFILILDEADELIRDEHKRQPQFVKALKELRELDGTNGEYFGPIAIISLSATLFPIYLDLASSELKDDENYVHWDVHDRRTYMAIAPKGKYVGLSDFITLKDKDGNDVFLDNKELKKDKLFWSQNLYDFYQDAASTPSSLVLDITCPYVWSHNWKTDVCVQTEKLTCNIHNKARHVINQFNDFVVCTYSGQCHSALYDKRDNFCKLKEDFESYVRKSQTDKDRINDQIRRKSGKAIRNRDEAIPNFISNVLLETEDTRPVAIFGYSMMVRGTSFRPDWSCKFQRTPTHIVLWMGPGMSIEKMVQALGRATYVHGSNRHGDTVKVLTTQANLESAKLYPELMQEIRKKIMDENYKLSKIFVRNGPLADDKWIPFLRVGKNFGQTKRDFVELGLLKPPAEALVQKIKKCFKDRGGIAYSYPSRDELEQDVGVSFTQAQWDTYTRKNTGLLKVYRGQVSLNTLS